MSRHWEWRDQKDLPRHQMKNAVFTGLGHTMAQQSRLVAPLRVALQSHSAVPLGVARPKGAATPPSEKYSPY